MKEVTGKWPQEKTLLLSRDEAGLERQQRVASEKFKLLQKGQFGVRNLSPENLDSKAEHLTCE